MSECDQQIMQQKRREETCSESIMDYTDGTWMDKI